MHPIYGQRIQSDTHLIVYFKETPSQGWFPLNWIEYSLAMKKTISFLLKSKSLIDFKCHTLVPCIFLSEPSDYYSAFEKSHSMTLVDAPKLLFNCQCCRVEVKRIRNESGSLVGISQRDKIVIMMPLVECVGGGNLKFSDAHARSAGCVWMEREHHIK